MEWHKLERGNSSESRESRSTVRRFVGQRESMDGRSLFGLAHVTGIYGEPTNTDNAQMRQRHNREWCSSGDNQAPKPMSAMAIYHQFCFAWTTPLRRRGSQRQMDEQPFIQ
jgi:hypothetical protein